MSTRNNNSRYDDFLDALNASTQGRPATSSTVVATDYTFNASAKTVAIENVDFVRYMFIVNITDGVVIYNPVSTSLGGTVIGKTISLTYDTASMSDTDSLLVMYERLPVEEEEDILDQILVELQKQTRLLEKVLT